MAVQALTVFVDLVCFRALRLRAKRPHEDWSSSAKIRTAALASAAQNGSSGLSKEMKGRFDACIAVHYAMYPVCTIFASESENRLRLLARAPLRKQRATLLHTPQHV